MMHHCEISHEARAGHDASDRLGNVHRRCLPVAVLAGILAVAATAPSTAAADASSIREFVEAKAKWPQLVGRPLNLEGRYTFFAGDEMRFAGCDVRFLLPERFIKPRGDSRNLEVSGRLEQRQGRYVFLVRDLKSRPSDMDVLRRQRVSLDPDHPDQFYELASWAHNRGEFYGDEQLRRASTGLFETGLAHAHDALEEDDVDGVRSLAAKASEFGLSPGLQRQYLHQANRRAFAREQHKPQPKYQDLLRQIRRDLPGCERPLPSERASLRKDYLQAPQAVYRVADEETRLLLNRILYSEVVLAAIEQDADENGRNGYEIAARIEQQVPERRDLARTYRDRELEYFDSRAAGLSRQQMLDVADRYEQRDQPEKAIDLKRRWLKSRERGAMADGPRGLMELGEEYLNLLQDEQSAARMFRLAYQEHPQLAAASQWLSEHGYELRDGRWSLPGERQGGEQDRLADAIRAGRPEVGMTGAQVRAALGGAPSTIARMASAGQVSEVWLYEELGISIQLNRRSHQTELTVRRVTDAP